MKGDTFQLKEDPTLGDLQHYVSKKVKERGFDGDTVAMRFMLLMEESGEFARAARKHAGLKFAPDTKTATELGHEAADILNILIGICNILGINLEEAYCEKEARNDKRTWK